MQGYAGAFKGPIVMGGDTPWAETPVATRHQESSRCGQPPVRLPLVHRLPHVLASGPLQRTQPAAGRAPLPPGVSPLTRKGVAVKEHWGGKA
eukprot:scaffold1784_cov364-Prasinococcus_capsulatus_cf.AAC.1